MNVSVRQQLNQEMEDTRLAFHRLLDQVPPEAYRLASDNPAWTIGEVLYHMSLAPRLIGTDVRMISGQGRLSQLIPRLVPRSLFDWLNVWVTRFGARNISREHLARSYDQAHAAASRALASISDDDFGKSLNYPGWDPLLSGEVTLHRLFSYIKLHFDAHAEQIRACLPADPPSP
jgi:hypothetical protein